MQNNRQPLVLHTTKQTESHPVERYCNKHQQHSSVDRNNCLVEKRDMVFLFDKLNMLYGNLFKQTDMQTAQDTMQFWFDELSSFTKDCVGKAYEKMKEHHINYPPTLLQFKKLCSDEEAIKRGFNRKGQDNDMDNETWESWIKSLYPSEFKLIGKKVNEYA